MGIELVKVALYQHAAGLSGRAFKVLMVMAVAALDKPNDKGQPAKLYFAGEEPLARALYDVSDAPTPNQLREVRRMLAELDAKGCIKPMVEHPNRRSGRAQRWRLLLTLGEANAGEIPPSKRGGDSPSDRGGDSPSNAGHIPPQTRGNMPTPRTHEESPEDLSQESIHRRASISPPRAHEASEAHAFVNDGFELCAVCEEGRLHMSHINHHRRTATAEAS